MSHNKSKCFHSVARFVQNTRPGLPMKVGIRSGERCTIDPPVVAFGPEAECFQKDGQWVCVGADIITFPPNSCSA